MIKLNEWATILNALRYYCEHNKPHEDEKALIAKLTETLALHHSSETGRFEPDENHIHWEKHGIPAILEK